MKTLILMLAAFSILGTALIAADGAKDSPLSQVVFYVT